MKKIFATLLLASGLSLAVNAQENTHISIGQKAPELEMQNPEGETVKLSDVTKGRVVLLDFWASWCGPCRAANPRLVAMYEQYKDKKFKGAKKGFTVFSVSLDKNKEAWVKAIQKDNLMWPFHMSDLGAWQSAATKVYGLEFIPQAFLINSEGKIIGKYMIADQAEEDLKKLLAGN